MASCLFCDIVNNKIQSGDPLNFKDSKKYKNRIKETQKKCYDEINK